MENFKHLMSTLIDFYKTPFTIWGFEFSFWSAFMVVTILSIVFWFVGNVWSD